MKVLDGLSTSVSVSVPVAVGVPGVAPPSSITEPVVVPEMMAASLVPSMVIVTTCGVPSMVVTVKRVGQRVAGIERLHRAVGVVERVDPHAGRRHREGAVAAIARRWRADRREGVGRIVDVGIGQRAGRRRRAVVHWRCRRPRSPSRSWCRK